MLDRLIKSLNVEEAAELLAMFDELEERKRIALCQNDFLAFIGALDPKYKFGLHLKRLGGLLMDVEKGYKDRIAVSMAPRMGKSQMISIYYPAWYLGRNPDHKVIVASHTADLAVVMARARPACSALSGSSDAWHRCARCTCSRTFRPAC